MRSPTWPTSRTRASGIPASAPRRARATGRWRSVRRSTSSRGSRDAMFRCSTRSSLYEPAAAGGAGGAQARVRLPRHDHVRAGRGRIGRQLRRAARARRRAAPLRPASPAHLQRRRRPRDQRGCRRRSTREPARRGRGWQTPCSRRASSAASPASATSSGDGSSPGRRSSSCVSTDGSRSSPARRPGSGAWPPSCSRGRERPSASSAATRSAPSARVPSSPPRQAAEIEAELADLSSLADAASASPLVSRRATTDSTSSSTTPAPWHTSSGRRARATRRPSRPRCSRRS